MPTSAELIQAQRDFEQPRGLDTYNTHWHSLMRIQGELSEAVEAYLHETPKDLAVEIIDVVIFAHSMLGRIADELGWKPEDVDQLVEAKMAANHTKYDEVFFQNGHDTSTAITLARHWHNLGLNDERLGNDYY